jgi:hypothetical protein
MQHFKDKPLSPGGRLIMSLVNYDVKDSSGAIIPKYKLWSMIGCKAGQELDDICNKSHPGFTFVRKKTAKNLTLAKK